MDGITKIKHVEEPPRRDFAAEKQAVRDKYQPTLDAIDANENLTDEEREKQKKPTLKQINDGIKAIEKDEKYFEKHLKQLAVEERLRRNSLYKLDDEGNILRTIENVKVFFQNTDKYREMFRRNEFTEQNLMGDRIISNELLATIRADVETGLGFNSRDIIETAILNLCDINSYNPIKEAIEPLKWDGVERVSTFFIKYLGVEDTPLNRSMTKKWFYAMMKRLYEPGCDFDNMIIIYDTAQGTGKTKIIKRLLESVKIENTYNTSAINVNNNAELIQALKSSWVVGIDELDSFLKASSEKAKSILSINADNARLSYRRDSETYKRHCVLYGNTNTEYFLKDYSGRDERRYWVMDAHGTRHDKRWWDENLPHTTCKLILAEALKFFKDNPDFNYYLDVDECNELEFVQRRHKTCNNDDVIQERVHYVLNRVYPFNNFDNMDMFVSYAMNTDQYTYTADNGQSIKCYEDVQRYCRDKKEEENMLVTFDSDEVKEQHLPHVITRLPIPYIKAYINRVAHRDLSTQYLMRLLGDGWEKKVCQYNGKSQNCISRRTMNFL